MRNFIVTACCQVSRKSQPLVVVLHLVMVKLSGVVGQARSGSGVNLGF